MTTPDVELDDNRPEEGARHPVHPPHTLTRHITKTLRHASIADHEEQPAEEDTTAFFSEADEVLRLIGSFSDPAAAHEAAAERVGLILDRYQEQATVLDPQLEAMVVPLLEAVRVVARSGGSRELLPHTCKVMYTLCKVRGYKTIVKFVPHEVADLEPLVALLGSLDAADGANWQVTYALMVWLSMVVMVPFDLAIIDSSSAVAADGEAAAPPLTLVERILQLARLHLGSTGPAREAAAVLCARLLTRPGLQPHLREFVRWGVAQIQKGRDEDAAVGADGAATATDGATQDDGKPRSALAQSFLTAGISSALACAMKLGHRLELLPQLPLLATVTNNPEALLNDSSVTRRKLGVKLLQRAALVYLPPTVAAWRYQRGARSLEHNLAASAEDYGVAGPDMPSSTAPASAAAAAAATAPPAAEAEEEGEGEESLVPEEIEGLIEQLLCGLKDSDTVVRWSAAKGVGRVTSRLPLELADDVVASALELLSDDEEANAWHGGCLALAELARRGLLLPSRLAEVVPRIAVALQYDVSRGAASVGTHVRDAACYVCWAFARAFDPDVMAAHVMELAPSLLVVLAFDREVNCRRAAAAAFQENVGRQGNFPHGIDIVTKADYYAVGARSNAYLGVGYYLAGHDEYRRPLLEHLLDVKARHWEPKLRLLAAQAAAKLAPLDVEWATTTMIPSLVARSTSADLKERHGAVHMLAEVLMGLVSTCHGGDGAGLPQETRKAVAGVVPNIEKMRLYKGRGGEVMRGAACRLLEVLALLRMPCGPKAALEKLKTIDECLKHPSESISFAAVAALNAVTFMYFKEPPPDALRAYLSSVEGGGGAPLSAVGVIRLGCDWGQQGILVPRYTLPLAGDPNPGLRRGFALALGALPRGQLAARPQEVVHALCVAARHYPHQPAELKDPETRRNAAKALLRACTCLGLKARGGELSAALWREAVEQLLRSFDDYQTDNRGDVGSWVREAAMQCAVPLLALACAPEEQDRVAAAAAEEAAAPAPKPAEAEGADAGVPEAVAAAAAPIKKEVTAEERAAEAAELAAMVPELSVRLARALVQQLNEKIDRMRQVAGTTMRSLLAQPGLPPLPHHEQLCELLCVDLPGGGGGGGGGEAKARAAKEAAAAPVVAIPAAPAAGTTAEMFAAAAAAARVAARPDEVDFFVAPTRCFGVSVGAAGLAAYRRDALRGVAVSAGGITSTTSKPAGAALEKLAASLSPSELTALGDDLLALLEDHKEEDRLAVPLLRTAQLLVEAKRLDPLLHSAAAAFGEKLLGGVRGVTRGSKEVGTLIVGLSVQILLLPYAQGALLSDLLRSCVLLLAHRYPKVRKAAADQLYLHLLTYGDPGPLSAPPPPEPPKAELTCGFEEVAAEEEPKAAEVEAAAPAEPPAAVDPGRLDALMSLLLETPWLSGVEGHARPARYTMLELLQLPQPLVAAAPAAKAKAKPSDEGTYAELVNEAGY